MMMNVVVQRRQKKSANGVRQYITPTELKERLNYPKKTKKPVEG